MRVAIHQPQFLPYPGFFHKLGLVDKLVVMDSAQYDRRFTNRNRILAPQGPVWLTVPIDKSQKFRKNMEVKVNNSLPWRGEHWKKISYSYKNASWFDSYGPYFESLYQRHHDLLIDLDLETTKQVMAWLGLEVPVELESELGVGGDGTQRLVNICKATGADTYVSGIGGKNYIDEGVFTASGIKLEYQQYQATAYGQRFSKTFVPNLSVVDMLFNIGPECRKSVLGERKLSVSTTPHK
jgi:hypothetical protein